MEPQVYAQAWVAIIGAIFAGLVMLLNTYLSWRNSQKIDANTHLTRVGAEAATVSAVASTEMATKTGDAVDRIDKKLNGGVDSAIKEAITPVASLLEEHVSKDDTNFEEIKAKFNEVSNYMHVRNHDILNALNKQGLDLKVLLEKSRATEVKP